MNEYARTKSPTDSRRRDMVKIVVGHMTGEHGYVYNHHIPTHLNQILCSECKYLDCCTTVTALDVLISIRDIC